MTDVPPESSTLPPVLAGEAGGGTEGASAPPAPVKWMISRREFRARAHSNPLADGSCVVPASPEQAPWGQIFLGGRQRVDWLDVGCGYGGLLAGLGRAYPEKVMLGMEIRGRVAAYCEERVRKLREEAGGKEYANVGFARVNVMKFLVFWIGPGWLEKMFFCYPDPHFKKKKNRQRVVSQQLLAEYAFVMKAGGVAYVVTDVKELFDWMVKRFEEFPLFERRSHAVDEQDPVVPYVRDQTDEAQRVVKGGRKKFLATFTRLPNPPI